MGRTNLHKAALVGDAERVKELLKKGANPNIKNEKGRTPLHAAAYKGHVEVARLLLEHGADPNTQDKDGNTPLHWAAYKGHVDVARLLLEHGADPNIESRTALRHCTGRHIRAMSIREASPTARRGPKYSR
jgi:ankyrin repeat protein